MGGGWWRGPLCSYECHGLAPDAAFHHTNPSGSQSLSFFTCKKGDSLPLILGYREACRKIGI